MADTEDYVICVRRVRNGKFDPEPNEPGAAKYLTVPTSDTDIAPSHEVAAKNAWTQTIIEKANGGPVQAGKAPVGDILFFVHGFNTPTKTMMERHRKIRKHLRADGFKGVLISFDWPCNTKAVNYAEDRWDAKKTAIKLVQNGIMRFSQYHNVDCDINMHILAHSMGTFVVREAFDDADDVAKIASVSWSVSQVMLIGGDISSKSLGANRSKSSSLYRHAVRLTNYFNPYDDILKLSNVKRVGVSPRAGRVGMPDQVPGKAVDVDCGKYFEDNASGFTVKYPGHNWYFDDAKFFKDVHATIKGDVDRHKIKTRVPLSNGKLRFTG